LSSQTQFIAKLEKILTFLKNSKLEYLKASDRFNLPQNKRFFNKQSTIRNRFFHDIASLLRSMNVEIDNLVINRLNFEQIASSTNTKTTQSHLQKCIELDKKLVQLYGEALEIDSTNEVLKHQNDKIANVIEENIHFLENTGFVLES
tara:strand:+ start:1054 stop:1494 length:441 start_codon:yes stop_codon:yes gene_type:complete